MSPGSAIVIVSHNSAECIEDCLRSATAGNDWLVVLVDNASTDATVEIVRRVAPNIRMLLNQQNTGFAAAVNQGIKVAECETLVLLNPDTVPAPVSVDRLRRALAPDSVGAVGGLLTKKSGSPEIGFTVRRFPTLSTALAEILLLNRMFPRNPLNRRYRCLELDYTRMQEVDQPAGACLAIKRKAWEDLGGFDEGFFPVWFEDVDFCRRLHSAGWRILYCPDAVFLHEGAHSVSKLSFRDRQCFWYRNMLRYFAKHHRRREVALLRVGIVVGLLFRALLSLLGVGHSDISVGEAVRGYWDVALRCVIKNSSVDGYRK